MQRDATTPSEFLASLDDDWRRTKVETLRGLIMKNAPDFTESISYKMLAYGDDQGIVFHLTAQKNYVSLYVGDASKVDPSGELLAALDVGKGCIRFGKSVVIEQTGIDEFIERSVAMRQRGEDIGC